MPGRNPAFGATRQKYHRHTGQAEQAHGHKYTHISEHEACTGTVLSRDHRPVATTSIGPAAADHQHLHFLSVAIAVP